MTNAAPADPFAPVTGTAAPRPAIPPELWEPQMPAPEEPPPANAIRHPKHGAAAQRWVYRDATGQPLFATVRFDVVGGGKEVLPSSYGHRVWTTQAGRRRDITGWHLKRAAAPLPLYGLDRLAAAPDAPVIVVEGEKTADAVPGLFPEYVAIAALGGSQSPDKSDWSPLAGRHVVIWPDADVPGMKFARLVAELAQETGAASVRIVQVQVGNFPAGWDLADSLPDGIDVGHLKTMLSEAMEPIASEDDSENDSAAPNDNEEANTKRHRGKSGRTQSALAMRRAKALRRDGVSFDQMVANLLSDPQTAEWTRDKGQPNGARELRRLWDKCEPKGKLIRLVVGELHVAADAAEQALIEANLPIFQRGDVGLVQPVSREVPASHGRMTIAAGLIDLNIHSATDHLCAVAEWERFDGRAEDWVRTNPPAAVVQILLHRHGRFTLPSVVGVITTPTMRRDGSLLTAPGYDPATRLYHVAEPGLRLHSAVHNPTKRDAEGALRLLSDLLTEFPFTRTARPDGQMLEVSKSVALSAIITPVVRGAMSVAPLHAFNAHAPGSGKSYLADVVSTVSTNRPCPVISAAADEAETEKRIAGLLLAGYPIVSLDNVNGELGGDLLCQAVERPLLRIRRLGASDITEIESCVTMYATGNGLRVRGDMVRRSLVAELDPEMERPETRKFSGDPVATVQADRSRYVSACIIIVRAYLLAGRPGLLPSIASFSHWSDLVRSALVWLGCPDPAISMEAAREDDPELTELREVMEAWDEAISSEPKTIRAAAEIASRTVVKPDENGDHRGYGPAEVQWPALNDAFNRIAGARGSVDTAKLGKWMLSKAGRIIGGRRFQKDGKTDGTVRWKLSKVRPQVPG
jgi:hypothetical protein